jgi:hypothetical protein
LKVRGGRQLVQRHQPANGRRDVTRQVLPRQHRAVRRDSQNRRGNSGGQKMNWSHEFVWLVLRDFSELAAGLKQKGLAAQRQNLKPILLWPPPKYLLRFGPVRVDFARQASRGSQLRKVSGHFDRSVFQRFKIQ